MDEPLQMNWPQPPAGFALGARDVHVWTAGLRLPTERAVACELTLSPDEQNRAGRFLFERDRSRFVAGRGILRAILSRYLHLEPRQIKFTYSDRGKPSVAGLQSADKLHFNLAHSEELAVFAVSKIPDIGIDLERVRVMNDTEGIAERFFTPRETKLLKALPAGQKQAAFFNLWTRKEAWLKATGEGIGESLNQVEVSFLPGEPAQLFSIRNDVRAAAKWTLRELIPAPGYLGALAVPATDFQVQCWTWHVEDIPTMPLPPDASTTRPQNHERRL